MLETKRLILRQWTESDTPAFIELNGDAEVMEYFPKVLSESETHNFIEAIQRLINEQGWGFWAAEIKDTSEFIGMVGLNFLPFPLPGVHPDDSSMEVGWRLAKRFWGKGYATEAAQASLDYAFQTLKEKNVYAITVVANQRSRHVMEKLHMTNLERNFLHPNVAADNPMAEHVLYQVTRNQYIKTRDWM